MGLKDISDEKIDKLRSNFPVKFNDDITLYLLNDNVFKRETKCEIVCAFDLIDNYGYKYRQDYHHILSAKRTYKEPRRFFFNNPFTYDNINNFCQKNNVNLYVDGTGLPISGYAREKLDMIDLNGNIHKISWNELQHYTFRYKDDYEEIKTTNFEETHMTKEKAIPIILSKYEELKRPLLQRDFQGVQTTENSIGIRVIWKIWGTFTNMIRELGLPEHDYFYKPHDKNYVPHEEIIDGIHRVIMRVKQSGRKTLMYSDFIDEHIVSNMSTLRRHCKLDGVTLNLIIESYGCIMQPSGNGFNHVFPDGEKVVSKYEYDFSDFLKKNGFIYGKTYFRNFYYRKLDEDYNGNMNCDYLLNINGNEVYIELAGILGNKEHMEAYRKNTPIKSKSKEEYKNKLYLKRDIFERNGLEYYILLKDEMNEDNYKRILEKYMKKVA